PAMVWNLLDWRATHLPGPVEPNVALGMMARVATRPGTDQATLVSPAGERQSLAVTEGVVTWEPDVAGEWQVRVGDRAYAVAVNALRQSTSDLREASSGRWGDRLDAQALTERYQAVSWLLLLLVLAALAGHGFLV